MVMRKPTTREVEAGAAVDRFDEIERPLTTQEARHLAHARIELAAAQRDAVLPRNVQP